MQLIALRSHPDAAALAVILGFSALRLLVAGELAFQIDESNSIAQARQLSLSYFDHAPLHYWIVHALMPLLGDGHAARLPFVIMFAVSSWLLYRLTRLLFGGGAGYWAVLALNLSFFFTFPAAIWIFPDGPLFLFLLAAALTLANEFFGKPENAAPWRTWLLTGVWLGLAGLSKYYAVFFPVGLLLYLATEPGRRRTLLHPAPWLGALLAFAIFAPVFVWNAEHGWVSILYQSGRGLPSSGRHLSKFFTEVLAQVAWIAIWVFVPLAIAAWRALRDGRSREQSWYCLCLGMPNLIFFSAVPLWNGGGIQPHWTMAGWLMFYPVLGDYLDRTADKVRTRRWAIISAALLMITVALILGETATGFAKRQNPSLYESIDYHLGLVEWSPLFPELKARGYLDRKNLFIIAPYWIDAARIDQAIHGALPVMALGGNGEQPKNFDFRYDAKSFVGWDALMIGRTREISPDMEQLVRQNFQAVEELPPFAFGRGGMTEITLRIVLAKNLMNPIPSFYQVRYR